MQTSASEVSASLVDASIAKTADLSQFNPGNIISDTVFYNSATMTEAQIQSFLASKVSSCRSGYTCLKDYYVQTRSIGASAMCGAYSGGGTERASRVIYKVAQACGINPQVLIVMLQKEQGLVTSTAPSSWAYQAAMGQGCPDTAGCDVYYYGFFNQMYGAARQLKIYTVYPTSFNYQAGRTNTIYWSPKAACGTSQVYIENQATANLYIFTPYRPNAAALRAGYGTGDSCSSYGNRNFYNYFTDWFGSTQAPDSVLYSVSGAIYFVSAGARYHILPSVWPAYKRAFGDAYNVDQSFIDHFTDAGKATLFLHDNARGVVAYLDAGATHRFPTCGLVSSWGGGWCASLTRMDGDDFARIPSGSTMTEFASAASGGFVYRIVEGGLQPYVDMATAAASNGGKTPYAATMPDSVVSRFTKSRMIFPTGSWITIAGSSRVWMPLSDGRLIYLPSWETASQIGLTRAVSYVGLQDAAMEGYAQSGSLTSFVSCRGGSYFGGEGVLYPISPDAATGFSIVALPDDLCAKLTVSESAAGPLFIAPAGSYHVYVAVDGLFQHVENPSKLAQLAGGATPRVISVSASAVARLPVLELGVVSGAFIAQSGTPAVYLVDDLQLHHLPSWLVAQNLGLGTSAISVSSATMSRLAESTDPLSHFVSCDGALFSPAGGVLSRVTSGDSAGNPVVALSSGTCGKLDLSGSDVTGRVFLTDGTSWVVAESGGFRRLSSADEAAQLNGGVAPTGQTVSAAYLAWLRPPTT
ncbi:hypothetical protein [Microbacterium schleiferi]|uniref:hypothetical protein n=1 Tax=Microbacterium schleiferi TaxID=69362 RepID=UPI00312001E1